MRSLAGPCARFGVLSCVVVLGATLTAIGGAHPPSLAQAADTTTPSAPLTPLELSQKLAALASDTAVQWTAHELANGSLEDPVLGPLAGNYGVSMTGQALVEVGLDAGNQTLIDDGLRSVLSEVSHPDGGGFELLGLSDAYAFDDAHLAGNPAWVAARPRLARYLRRRDRSISDIDLCYTSPHCYTNLKLVSAVADLALLQTGLRGYRRDALLSDPAGLRAQALAWIRMAVRNTGDDAYRSGSVAFSDAGILSDPSENPLAYHALSTMMLGKAILMLGSQATPHTRAAFMRAAQALVGLMAPDGDDTYIGRGQAQVWTVAATIDALAIAAELTSDPTWRGRYLSAAALALERLEALYPTSGWGFPLVPRFADVPAPTSYHGIDYYANSVEYNGLALAELQDAAAQFANTQPAPAEVVPSLEDGAFVEASHTRFAAVTNGDMWFAIHAIDSNPGDARYGFGLIAAELDTVDGWEPALPPRPLTTRPAPGGLAMETGHVTLYPAGTQISASSAGEVTIRGGWSGLPKLVDRGTVWTFRPTAAGNGVTLSFVAARRATYELQVWYEAGARLARSRQGVVVDEPDGSTQTYSLDTGVRFSSGARASSAYDASLQSVVMTVPASAAARLITYTTTLTVAAPGPSPTGATGPTSARGATGATGATG